MRKISLLAVTVILVGVGLWATTTNPTPHDATVGIPIDPLQVTTKASDLPTYEVIDCTFVFPVDCSPAFQLALPSSEPNATASRLGP